MDIVYVRGDTARRLFAAARDADILPGLTAMVPRAEHLIAMKVLAMKNDPERRLRELADIEAVLQSCEIDGAELEGIFSRYGMEEALRELRRTV